MVPANGNAPLRIGLMRAAGDFRALAWEMKESHLLFGCVRAARCCYDNLPEMVEGAGVAPAKSSL